MHNIKVAIANLANDIYRYKNIKRKLHSCSAHILFTHH